MAIASEKMSIPVVSLLLIFGQREQLSKRVRHNGGRTAAVICVITSVTEVYEQTV